MLHPGDELAAELQREISTELNVKVLEDIDTLSGLMSWTVIPNFRVLGPRLGPKVNDVKQALATADGSALHEQLETQGFVEIAGERLEATDVDVRAQRHEAFALSEDDGWAVALDLELDDDLRAEGLARELVRALNDLRKDLGFAIADRVRVTLDVPTPVRSAIDTHRDWIAGEVLATSLELGDVRPMVAPSTSTNRRCARVARTGRRRLGRGRRGQRRKPKRDFCSGVSVSKSASKKARIALSASSSGTPRGSSLSPKGEKVCVGGPDRSSRSAAANNSWLARSMSATGLRHPGRTCARRVGWWAERGLRSEDATGRTCRLGCTRQIDTADVDAFAEHHDVVFAVL